MISQLSIFLENEGGRLAAATRAVSNTGSNMSALFLADTQDFGVVRVLCDRPKKTAEALKAEGWRAAVTDVLAVKVPDHPGGLADLLEYLDEHSINVEYGYCISIKEGTAVDILKVSDASVEKMLAEAGFSPVQAEEIYEVD